MVCLVACPLNCTLKLRRQDNLSPAPNACTYTWTSWEPCAQTHGTAEVQGGSERIVHLVSHATRASAALQPLCHTAGIGRDSGPERCCLPGWVRTRRRGLADVAGASLRPATMSGLAEAVSTSISMAHDTADVQRRVERLRHVIAIRQLFI